jgi:hypothetical protein
MIEEPVEVRDVPLALRIDDTPPRRVYLAPGRTELACAVTDGYVTTTVPVVPGHALVVFEE